MPDTYLLHLCSKLPKAVDEIITFIFYILVLFLPFCQLSSLYQNFPFFSKFNPVDIAH